LTRTGGFVAGLFELAKPFLDARVLDLTPLRLVDVVAPRFGEHRADVLLALAMVIEAENRGHTALDFGQIARLLPPRIEPVHAAAPRPVPTEAPREETSRGGDDDVDATRDEAMVARDPEDDEDPTVSSSLDWSHVLSGARGLATSPLVGALNALDRPFARLDPRGDDDSATLYLTRRFLDIQERVAGRLVELATSPRVGGLDAKTVETAKRELFKPKDSDSQGTRGMALCLDGGRLTVISGGPGTGKTFSIARTLAALLIYGPRAGIASPRIVLAAPTGKAAVRMTEAIAEAVKPASPVDKDPPPPVAPEIRKALHGLPSMTVHKLLGIHPGTSRARHHADHPLPYDLVIVDEASMLDVALMLTLLEAIGPGTRLVLLGDRDQLASVDAGTVLADLVAGHLAGTTDALASRVVFYRENYRFEKAPAVGRFAKCVRSPGPETKDALKTRLAEASAVLRSKEYGSQVEHLDLPDGPTLPRSVVDTLAQPYLDGYVKTLEGTFQAKGPLAASDRDRQATALLSALDAYRVLCTHREGRRGVGGLNREIGGAVRKRLQATWRVSRKSDLPERGRVWLGMPVLIVENAYDVDLRNGDVGLVLLGPSGQLEACFLRKGNAKYPHDVQWVTSGRLPPWMPAFAMTIHKSQGSQYQHVAMVLAGRESPIETRELVYTAVTRSMGRVRWVGSQAALERALERPVGRVSALQRFLADALARGTTATAPARSVQAKMLGRTAEAPAPERASVRPPPSVRPAAVLAPARATLPPLRSATSPREDAETLLTMVLRFGAAKESGSVGNMMLRELLCWDEARYLAAREVLLADGRIELGKGRGGSVRLAATPEAQAMHLVMRVLATSAPAMVSTRSLKDAGQKQGIDGEAVDAALGELESRAFVEHVERSWKLRSDG
ncbi:MAG: exodeoxyribonuclease V subunit alpha, partial [Deltaproteobacteria bacterium]